MCVCVTEDAVRMISLMQFARRMGECDDFLRMGNRFFLHQ